MVSQSRLMRTLHPPSPFGKGFCKAAHAHILVGRGIIEQTRVELCSDRPLVHVLSDEDEHLGAVSVAGVPVGALVGTLAILMNPVLARHRCPPHPGGIHAAHAARLRPLVGDAVVRGDPEEALGAKDARPVVRIVDVGVELVGVERLRGPVGEARDAVFFCLRRVLALEFLDPAGRGSRPSRSRTAWCPARARGGLGFDWSGSPRRPD